MFKTILFLLFLSSINNKEVIPMTSQGDNATTPNTEEYAVYSAYLDGIGNGRPVRLIVLNNQTMPADTGCYPVVIGKQNKEITDDQLKMLFEDLKAKEKTRTLLKGSFNIRYEYNFLDKDGFDAFFKPEYTGGWDRFYKKYPASYGYITFSRVGFNTNLTKAIMFRVISCGNRCVSSDYFLFEKTNGQWKQVNAFHCRAS